MGISATFEAFKNAWYTVTQDGYPSYRLNEDGTVVTPAQREQYTAQTSKSYGLPINTMEFFTQPDNTVAYA